MDAILDAILLFEIDLRAEATRLVSDTRSACQLQSPGIGRSWLTHEVGGIPDQDELLNLELEGVVG